jgi:hypothetical protein
MQEEANDMKGESEHTSEVQQEACKTALHSSHHAHLLMSVVCSCTSKVVSTVSSAIVVRIGHEM